MYKYSFFFASGEECNKAERWIRDNIIDIEDYDVSYDGCAFFFYIALPLHDIEWQQIESVVAPVSFLVEEL